jgi:hypothetical protein
MQSSVGAERCPHSRRKHSGVLQYPVRVKVFLRGGGSRQLDFGGEGLHWKTEVVDKKRKFPLNNQVLSLNSILFPTGIKFEDYLAFSASDKIEIEISHLQYPGEKSS